MALKADFKILNDKLFFFGMSPNFISFWTLVENVVTFHTQCFRCNISKTLSKVEYYCTVNDDGVSVDLNYNVNFSEDC